MANTFAPAVAKAAKVTVPAGSSGPWHMTLHGDDSSTDQTIDVTAGAGLQSFSKSLVDGVTYTISEDASSVAGYDFSSVSGSSNVSASNATKTCTFTVHYPAGTKTMWLRPTAYLSNTPGSACTARLADCGGCVA